MVIKILKLSVLSFIAFSFSAKAEDAHVHGEAVLEVVIDDAGALLRFEAPAIDIVGFEYLPKTDEEQQAIDAKITLLGTMSSVAIMSEAAGCVLAEVHVDFEAEEHEGEVEHIAFHAEYELDCADVSALTYLQATVFDQFPALKDMDVEVVMPTGQKGAHLEPDRTKLEL